MLDLLHLFFVITMSRFFVPPLVDILITRQNRYNHRNSYRSRRQTHHQAWDLEQLNVVQWEILEK
jgi:hypothetical protein